MSLNLSLEDQVEYLRRCAINQAAKEEAIRVGDAKAAKRARQANTALYHEFEAKSIRAPQPRFTRLMTIEERIEQIEAHLGIFQIYV